MTRLKILYLTTGLDVGGAEMMLYHLLAGMDRTRFEPVVVSLMECGKVGADIAALDIPVYALGMRAERPVHVPLLPLVRTIRAAKPDLIQGWMHHGSLAAQVASICSFRRIPVLWCIQNSVYSLAYEKRLTAAIIRLCAYLSRLPAKIIFVSHTSQMQHRNLGYSMHNSCVIPNGADTSRFIPSIEARRTVRSALELPEDALLIGLIARYHPQKDHATFLQAAALLAKTYPDVHFLLAGRDVDRTNEDLYRLVQEFNLSSQVHLLGERRDVPCLTAALDIAAFSSAFGEGLPLAVAEAMASGAPCVVTDVGDTARLVSDTGIVVPPRAPQSLANGLVQLIRAGADTRRALGQVARKRIEQNYSLESIVRNYENLYLSLGSA